MCLYTINWLDLVLVYKDLLVLLVLLMVILIVSTNGVFLTPIKNDTTRLFDTINDGIESQLGSVIVPYYDAYSASTEEGFGGCFAAVLSGVIWLNIILIEETVAPHIDADKVRQNGFIRNAD